jgi:hypothetical protein
MGPYQLPDSLTAQRYCDFLETVLLGLLEDVPLAVRQKLWCSTMQLQRTILKISDSGWFRHIQESELNVEVNICVSSVTGYKSDGFFFLWGLPNGHIYALNSKTIANLMTRLQQVVTTVDANVFNRVRENAVLRIDACLEMGGGRFQCLL